MHQSCFIIKHEEILFHGYGFCQVSWLVHIVASLDAGIVCQELHGDDGKNGRNEGIHSWNTTCRCLSFFSELGECHIPDNDL